MKDTLKDVLFYLDNAHVAIVQAISISPDDKLKAEMRIAEAIISYIRYLVTRKIREE